MIGLLERAWHFCVEFVWTNNTYWVTSRQCKKRKKRKSLRQRLRNGKFMVGIECTCVYWISSKIYHFRQPYNPSPLPCRFHGSESNFCDSGMGATIRERFKANVTSTRKQLYVCNGVFIGMYWRRKSWNLAFRWITGRVEIRLIDVMSNCVYYLLPAQPCYGGDPHQLMQATNILIQVSIRIINRG